MISDCGEHGGKEARASSFAISNIRGSHLAAFHTAGEPPSRLQFPPLTERCHRYQRSAFRPLKPGLERERLNPSFDRGMIQRVRHRKDISDIPQLQLGGVHRAPTPPLGSPSPPG